MNKKIAVIVLISVIIGGAVAFFYPRERVVGGLRGGPIGPGETAYREEYSCFGFKRDFCPNWPDYGCDQLCYGIAYNKKCYNEIYEFDRGIQKTVTVCK